VSTAPRDFDDWKRHAVYLKDGYACAYSGYIDKTCTGKLLALDHIIPIAGKPPEGGGPLQNKRDEPATNLTTAHGPTNSAKGKMTQAQWSAYAAEAKLPVGTRGARAGMKFDWKDIENAAHPPPELDMKRGEQLSKLAAQARAARRLDSNGKRTIETPKSKAIAAKSQKIVAEYQAEQKAAAEKKTGPGVQHDPHTGQFMPGGTMPSRVQFRASIVAGEALALDPGGGGLIASVQRGATPSPQAFGFFFDIPGPLVFDPEAIDDGIAILCLDGPIEHHDRSRPGQPAWCHSYEALAREMRAASLCPEVRAGILKIDSPGGVAAGMGETHRAIRRLQAETGVGWFAFADELACSAAYNLASACREVWTTRDGHVGSVGVILCAVDETAALDKAGIAVRYLVTGKRKADLHPGAPLTDDVLDVAQAKVDKLGRHFFRSVAKARAGAGLDTPEKVTALQAGVFIGDDAVRVGLADGVASWDRFLSLVKKTAKRRPVQRAA
jgi:ClpP class serine protease